jgi:hypothetical protein
MSTIVLKLVAESDDLVKVVWGETDPPLFHEAYYIYRSQFETVAARAWRIWRVHFWIRTQGSTPQYYVDSPQPAPSYIIFSSEAALETETTRTLCRHGWRIWNARCA